MKRFGNGFLIALAIVAASCGDGGSVAAPTTAVVAVPVAARQLSAADPALAGDAISQFGTDLFAAVRSNVPPGENMTVSPLSVGFTLAMVEPGTVGDAQSQIRRLLRIDDPVRFHASMNALEQDLDARRPGSFSPGDDPGEVNMRIVNAAYLQRGYPFEAAYLETIGSNYGPALNEVDFTADPDAVAHMINAFVADATHDRITDLIADGQIRPETVLALVDALYMKASWLETFDVAVTTEQTFTGLDGGQNMVSMMNGFSTSSASGDGWIGATKSYVGGLSAQFILPDEGRFDEIATDLDRVFTEYDVNRTDGSTLGLPRFDARFDVELSAPLQALGWTGPFQPGGLLGVANDPQLVIDKVIHQTDVAMDEEGTEAAAATVVLMYPVSAPMIDPVPVVLDRPFLYRIIDDESGATLFIGQIVTVPMSIES